MELGGARLWWERKWLWEVVEFLDNCKQSPCREMLKGSQSPLRLGFALQEALPVFTIQVASYTRGKV